MAPPHPPSESRDRRRKRISREIIVDASIRLLRRVGPEKFSIRALASDLGVTPMAIYRHVPSKQALMEEVRQSLLSLVPLVADTNTADKPNERVLSEKEIVDEALRLVRAQGLSRLNMRALAKRLGVTPMALYRHIPNKETLLSRMSDVLISELPRPEPSPASWQDDFRAHARLVWQKFSEYPGLVGSFLSGPSPTVLDHMRYEHGILLAGGVDEHSASLAITVYHTFLLGLFRTHAYLDFLARHEGKKTGVKKELIRRYDDRLQLTDLLDFALDALVAGLQSRRLRAKRG